MTSTLVASMWFVAQCNHAFQKKQISGSSYKDKIADYECAHCVNTYSWNHNHVNSLGTTTMSILLEPQPCQFSSNHNHVNSLGIITMSIRMEL